MIKAVMCWYCGSPVTSEVTGRSLRCRECGKDLRVCENCRFLLPGSRSGCSEANADPVLDKERANFCDWFSLDPKFRGQTPGRKKEQKRAVEAKTAFDNLFK
jgi:hypothetical protein